MALLPPDFMETVVAIGSKDEAGDTRWTGTGFLYRIVIDEDAGTGAVFLITNKHVVMTGKSEVPDWLYIRMNCEGTSGAIELPVGPDNWKFHQDADVAAVHINASLIRENQISFKCFNETLTPSKATDVGVSEGDGVFVLGFPQGNIGSEDRNFVIVRQGCVARIQDWLTGESQKILIDAPVYPGNSGGPVVLKPEAMSIQNTKSNNRSYLIGMVESYIPYRDVAISPQTNRPRVMFEENSGLANVVPGDVILKTIEMILADENIKRT